MLNNRCQIPRSRSINAKADLPEILEIEKVMGVSSVIPASVRTLLSNRMFICNFSRKCFHNFSQRRFFKIQFNRLRQCLANDLFRGVFSRRSRRISGNGWKRWRSSDRRFVAPKIGRDENALLSRSQPALEKDSFVA